MIKPKLILIQIISFTTLMNPSFADTLKDDKETKPTIQNKKNKEGKEIDLKSQLLDKKFYDVELDKKQKELEKISLEASLQKVKFEKTLAKLQEEIQLLELKEKLKKLKLESEFLDEKITLERELIEKKKKTERAKIETELLRSNLEQAQQKLEMMCYEQKKKTELAESTTKQLKAELEKYKSEKERRRFAYRPSSGTASAGVLDKNGNLTLNSRKIELEGIIWPYKAERIAREISFYNKQNPKEPIFIVMDICFGGSAWAGNVILTAMRTSKAPVYVVVKSYVASMAAIITTLAKKSFALPQATILHHQPHSVFYGNVREKEHHLKKSQEYSENMLGRVAKKMGISYKTFIDKMYQNSPDGDWEEYTPKAVKLKWVDTQITGIHDESIEELPESKDYTWKKYLSKLYDIESGGASLEKENGKTYIKLPQLQMKKDFYFIHNDGRFRLEE